MSPQIYEDKLIYNGITVCKPNLGSCYHLIFKKKKYKHVYKPATTMSEIIVSNARSIEFPISSNKEAGKFGGL